MLGKDALFIEGKMLQLSSAQAEELSFFFNAFDRIKYSIFTVAWPHFNHLQLYFISVGLLPNR